MTPFFATKKEVVVSEKRAEHFRQYRVFKLRHEPKMFVLPGSLRESYALDPIRFRVSIP